jgi:hypothetical protein
MFSKGYRGTCENFYRYDKLHDRPVDSMTGKKLPLLEKAKAAKKWMLLHKEQKKMAEERSIEATEDRRTSNHCREKLEHKNLQNLKKKASKLTGVAIYTVTKGSGEKKPETGVTIMHGLQRLSLKWRFV